MRPSIFLQGRCRLTRSRRDNFLGWLRYSMFELKVPLTQITNFLLRELMSGKGGTGAFLRERLCFSEPDGRHAGQMPRVTSTRMPQGACTFLDSPWKPWNG